MSNIEDFDEQDHDSSEGEGGNKKAYEALLSNPSYFSSAMKVGTIQGKCVLNLVRFSRFKIDPFNR